MFCLVRGNPYETVLYRKYSQLAEDSTTHKNLRSVCWISKTIAHYSPVLPSLQHCWWFYLKAIFLIYAWTLGRYVPCAIVFINEDIVLRVTYHPMLLFAKLNLVVMSVTGDEVEVDQKWGVWENWKVMHDLLVTFWKVTDWDLIWRVAVALSGAKLINWLCLECVWNVHLKSSLFLNASLVTERKMCFSSLSPCCFSVIIICGSLSVKRTLVQLTDMPCYYAIDQTIPTGSCVYPLICSVSTRDLCSIVTRYGLCCCFRCLFTVF